MAKKQRVHCVLYNPDNVAGYLQKKRKRRSMDRAGESWPRGRHRARGRVFCVKKICVCVQQVAPAQ